MASPQDSASAPALTGTGRPLVTTARGMGMVTTGRSAPDSACVAGAARGPALRGANGPMGGPGARSMPTGNGVLGLRSVPVCKKGVQ